MKTILIALDGSSRAADVLATGATVARAMGARVVLFRAISIPPDFSPAGAPAGLEGLTAYLESTARRELTALLSRYPDVTCEIRTEHAIQPWNGILAASEAVGADLIVIGSHGYHGWDHLLGTTAGKVANHAKRNVLVVHDAGETTPTE